MRVDLERVFYFRKFFFLRRERNCLGFQVLYFGGGEKFSDLMEDEDEGKMGSQPYIWCNLQGGGGLSLVATWTHFPQCNPSP